MTRGPKPSSIVAKSPSRQAPRAPANLADEAKIEWRRVVPSLWNDGILTERDLPTMESYCVAFATMRQAHALLVKDGLVTPAGKRHPAVGIMNAAQQTMRLCATELGLTPVSRSRPAIRDDRDDDGADDLGLD